jgi:periplasmic divalent cation tolerance protein
VYLLLCNCPISHAEALARDLIGERLAACVNLSSPVKSIYRWVDKVVCEEEVMLFIKTGAGRVAATREHILKAHPYDVPEILCIPIDVANSHEPYVSWVREVSGYL